MPQTPEKRRAASAKARIARRHLARQYLGGRCARCGSARLLQIDHIRPPSKAANVSALWTHSMERFMDELVKCQLLCKRCHAEKTLTELHGPRQHGTYRMYRHGGCRCDPCRSAACEYQRNWKAKHGLGSVRRNKKAEHGTTAMYGYHRCHCEPCRAANRIYRADYRQRMRLKVS